MSQTHFDGPLASGPKQPGTPGGANVGLAVLSQTQVIQANGTTPLTATFLLPAGSQILEIVADTVVAWTATTASLQVGIAAGQPQYITAVDVKTVARSNPTLTAAAVLAMYNIGTNTSVVATITSTGPTAVGTTGVTVNYVQKS